MRAARAALVLVVASVSVAASSVHARPGGFRRGPPPPPPLPPPALETLPRFVELSHVDVLATEDAVLATTDLAIARGGWDGAAFDFFVAYGAPGLPAAFEARVLPAPADGVLPLQAAAGEALSASQAYEAPTHAAFSLGRALALGQTVHVDGAVLARAFAAGNTDRAFLRVRAVHRFLGASRFVPSCLVRLDTPRLGILPLGAVTVRNDAEKGPGLGVSTSAKLCRVDGTMVPLRIAQGAPDVGQAPFLTQRHAGEDLCVDLR